MSEELYRQCTLARCMQDQLDEMVSKGDLPEELAREVLAQLDTVRAKRRPHRRLPTSACQFNRTLPRAARARARACLNKRSAAHPQCLLHPFPVCLRLPRCCCPP